MLKSRIAKLEKHNRFRACRPLTQDDQDALNLYLGTQLLEGEVQLDFGDLERTRFFQRGRDLGDEMHGPVLPAHLDDHLKRCSSASNQFEEAFGCEPRAGDVLRFTDVQASWTDYLGHVSRFVEAWSRQLPSVPCPVKVENGGLHWHDSQGRWHESRDDSERTWRNVERCALGIYCEGRPSPEELAEHRRLEARLNELHPILAVTFLGVIKGKHRCRPATPDEIVQSARSKSADSRQVAPAAKAHKTKSAS
jgi:hypothetical protein